VRFYREIIRRLIALEQMLGSVTKKYVTKLDGLYYGSCGQGISEEQFAVWEKEQGDFVEVNVISISVVDNRLNQK
jgi:hypothetical protein